MRAAIKQIVKRFILLCIPLLLGGNVVYAYPNGVTFKPAESDDESPLTAYAVLSNDSTRLTFYYDDQKESRGGMSVGPFSYDSFPDWHNQRNTITTVVFDASFANCTSLSSTANWFYGLSKITAIKGIKILKTDNVKSMYGMFYGCFSLTSLDVSSFKTDNVTDMGYMFSGCYLLTSLDVSGFKTENVTSMSYMFDGCSSLTSLNVSNFKTDNVTDMSAMFMGCSSLTSLDVSGFKTDNVTSMNGMFGGCSHLTSLDLSGFKTDNVTDMSYMFSGCSNLTSLNLRGVKTDNVTSMNEMFRGCSNLTSLDLRGVKTDNVTSMNGMFRGCSNLTSLDLSGFKTDKVTDMGWMFRECSNLGTIYVGDGWTTEKVTKGGYMFFDCRRIVGGKGTTYNSSHTDHTYAHVDGGTSNPSYLSDVNALSPYAVLSNDNTVLTFYYDDQKVNRGIMSVGPFDSYPGWHNQKETISTVVFDASFANCTSLTSTSCWFRDLSQLTTITGLENLKTDNVTNMAGMFAQCSSLTNLDVSGFNTNNVTEMGGMFQGCSSLTSLDVSGFKTDNVTWMVLMFSDCSNLTSLDVSGFNTNNVTSMYGMFSGCSNLTSLDLSGFKTDNVTDMSWMFSGCSSLTSLDVSGFNTNNVTNMFSMFSGCSNLTSLDLSGFKTDNVTTMNQMFYYCSSLTSLDLSGFKTNNVTDMTSMFSRCSNLGAIYVGEGWTTKKVTDTDGHGVFSGCYQLVGSQGTVYNESHRDHTYAHIDGGSSNPGYLSGIITITPFVTNDMAFKVTSQIMKEVTYVNGPAAEQITVPSEVAYDGQTYAVTAIADSAFAGQPQLKSVFIPSSIKSAGKNLFAGSPRVAAITWEAPIKMTQEMAGTVVNNPNLLFYTDNASHAPDGVTNIINSLTMQAERIVLLDANENNDFYCPEEFMVGSISYTHAYQLFTVTGQCQGWESLVLPFDVTEITHEKNGVITPFGALQRGREFENGTKPFWLYEYTTGGRFAEAEGIEANVPYILSMPNEARLSDEYNLAGNITFKATNATVKATSGAKTVNSGNYHFTPSYQNGNSESVYLMNVNKNYDGNPKGSVFVRNDHLERQARPFEAYFRLDGSAGVKSFISIFDALTDGIRSMEPAKRHSDTEYYQLDGTKRSNLQRGFNIIRTKDKARKILMK